MKMMCNCHQKCVRAWLKLKANYQQYTLSYIDSVRQEVCIVCVVIAKKVEDQRQPKTETAGNQISKHLFLARLPHLS